MARKSKGPWWRASHQAYYANIRGKQVRLGTTLEEAQARFNALTQTPTEGITVRQLGNAFLADKKRQVAERTHVSYMGHLENFARVAGDLRAADIQARHVTAWLVSSGWAPNTEKLARRVLKMAWKWGCDQGYLAADPLRGLRVGSIDCRKTPSENDLVLWMAAIDKPHVRDWVNVALATGLRPGEQQTLEARHIDLKHRAITVTGKTGSRRVLLPQPAMALLEQLCKARPKGPLLSGVFGRGWHKQCLLREFRLISQRSGVHVTPHLLRHVYGTRLRRRAVDTTVIRDQLGHKSIATTVKFYVSNDDATILAALDKAM